MASVYGGKGMAEFMAAACSRTPHIMVNQEEEGRNRTRSPTRLQRHAPSDLFLPAVPHFLKGPQTPQNRCKLGNKYVEHEPLGDITDSDHNALGWSPSCPQF